MTKKATLVLLIFLCISVTTIRLYIKNTSFSNIFPQGIYIDKIDLGGLTLQEAKDKISEWAKNQAKKPIICRYIDLQWPILPGDISTINVEETLSRAISHLNHGNAFQRYLRRRALKTSPLYVDLAIHYNNEAIEKFLHEINEKIKVEPENAVFKVVDNLVEIEEDQEGVLLDEDLLKQEIIRNLWNPESIIQIPTKTWKAPITKKDLEALGIKVKAGEFSTTFNSFQKDRTENIKLSSNLLKGYIISPGEIFSFNEVVGERTGEKGYREAPIFVQNNVVPGIGGGICQVSSTLYNLALMTDMEIVERLNHSLPVSYVPLGRDATVDYNSIDLKFRNNTAYHILVDTQVKDSTLTISFFSSKNLTKNIKFYSETVKTIPSPITIKEDYNLKKGEVKMKHGSPGYQVKLWKIVYKDNKEEKLLISTDNYSPTSSVMYIGKKEPDLKESYEKLDATTTDNIQEENILPQ